VGEKKMDASNGKERPEDVTRISPRNTTEHLLEKFDQNKKE